VPGRVGDDQRRGGQGPGGMDRSLPAHQHQALPETRLGQRPYGDELRFRAAGPALVPGRGLDADQPEQRDHGGHGQQSRGRAPPDRPAGVPAHPSWQHARTACGRPGDYAHCHHRDGADQLHGGSQGEQPQQHLGDAMAGVAAQVRNRRLAAPVRRIVPAGVTGKAGFDGPPILRRKHEVSDVVHHERGQQHPRRRS